MTGWTSHAEFKVREVRSDITEETSGLILHGVNCKGVMNFGIAKAIRTKWPEVYTRFNKNGSGVKLLGTLDIVTINAIDKLFIGNGYTQLNYGYDGQQYASITAIETVIQRAFNWIRSYNELIDIFNDGELNTNLILKSSKLGCSLGGLDWGTQVKPIFEKYEDIFRTEAEIFYI